MSAGWRQDHRNPNRTRGSFHRGHIVRVNNTDRQRYDIETVDGAVYTDVEDAQPVGFTANKRSDDMSEVIVAELGGEASRMVIIMKVGDSEKHLQVEPGQMAIYNPEDPRQKVIISDDGTISIESTTGMSIKTQTLKIAANIEITGNITQDGSISSSGVHAAASHV